MASLRQPGKEVEYIGNSEDVATGRILRRTHQPKVFIDREFGENVLAFRYQREPTLDPLMRRQAVHVLPFKQDLARDGGPAPPPARERVDEGRFAGAIGTYQPDHFSCWYADIHGRQCDVAFVPYRQIFALQNAGHSSRPR